jgi:hypothetical protein
MSSLQTFMFLAVFGLLGIITFVAVLIAVRARTKLVAAVVPLTLMVSVVAGVRAEPLHWRWSREDFTRISQGDDVACAPGAAECRLGWWLVRGSQRFDEMVIVWLVAHDGCYAGHGLAMPLNGDNDQEAVAASARNIEGRSDLVTATPWRDGWYDLCFVS